MSLQSGFVAAAGADAATAMRLLQTLQSAHQAHDRGATVAAIAALVRLQPALAGQWEAVAQLAMDNGEVTLAQEALALFVEATGGNPLAQFRQAGMLAQAGFWEPAHRLLTAIPDTAVDAASYAHARGTSAMYLGHREEAREWLDRATRLQPLSGHAWLALATLADFAADPALGDRVLNHRQAMAAAPAAERGAFGHALGKVLATRGEHAAAFAAFDEGARLTGSGLTYRRAWEEEVAAEALAGFTPASLAALAARQTEDTGRTIFVTGLPRSGTTLVEQILTGHSTVGDGAETGRLALLVKEIGGIGHDAVAEQVLAGRAPELARLWQHWMDERFPGAQRVVDKTTGSGRMLGLAAALLPDAPLVWVVRDPLDCAWSCYRTCFMRAQPWSNDLADIAHHFALQDRLRQGWQEVLGDRLLVVPYEGLVEAPEQWIRRLLSHCGLAEEPQVFRPHENARAVTTSSVMQVRRPINRDGIGAAEPYRTFLEPFEQALRGA